MYARALSSTEPFVVKFACRNGITANPMYHKCDICQNRDLCEIYFELHPAPPLPPEEAEMVRKTLEAARNYSKKPKLTPEEQSREIKIGMAVVAVICFIAWLLS